MSTILVRLKRNWFDPMKQRRRKRDNPHEVPVSWKDQLPSDAEIVEPGAPVPQEPKKKSGFPQATPLDHPDNPSAVAKDAARGHKSAKDANARVAGAAENAIAGKK